MPTFNVKAPDGSIIKVNAPEGATEEQAIEFAASTWKPSESVEPQPTTVQNIAGGIIKGASRIGETALAPFDILANKLGIENSIIGRRDRGEAIKQFLQQYADPESLAYKTGDIGTQVAGTAGAGGVLAKGLTSISQAPRAVQLAEALSTGGMRAGGAGMGTRMAGGALAGGTAAGMIEPESAGAGAVIGGVLPPVVKGFGEAGGAIARALRGGKVSPEVVQLAQRAKELGIDIPADRIINSRPLNAVAASLNYVPLSGRTATESKMESQLSRAASRLIGQDSDNLALSLRKASDDLGSKFDTTLKGNKVVVDQPLFQELADVNNAAYKELGADGFRIISNQVDEIINKGVSGEIDGQAAYNIKRTLDRISRRNTPEAWHALELKKALMGALDRSLGEDAAKGFAEVRKQYGNMIDLEKVSKRGVEGGISVGKLANISGIRNKDLQELADIAAQFVKTRESPHGAAQRVVAGGAAAVLGGPYALAGGAAGGRLANTLLNSQMMRNAVMNQPQQGRLADLMRNAPASRSLALSAPALSSLLYQD